MMLNIYLWVFLFVFFSIGCFPYKNLNLNCSDLISACAIYFAMSVHKNLKKWQKYYKRANVETMFEYARLTDI